MDYTHFDTCFEEFLINIALTRSQAQRIDSSLLSLSELFVQSFVGDVEIYAQGSFATSTIVKPLTESQSTNGKAGEYDVDIVLERTNWGGAANSLDKVRELISNNERYAPLLEPPVKESCERIKYAPEQSGVGFHVDLVPIKLDGQDRFVALRTKDKWQPSDPTVIIDWFNGLSKKHQYLPAIVLCLKRMRDVADLQLTIPSVMVLALAGNLYEEQGSYGGDLIALLEKINDFLSASSLDLRIPGVDENLADKWNDEQLKVVKAYFSDVLARLNEAFDADDLDTIRQYLSDDFPSQRYLENLHSLRSQSWAIQLNGSLERPVIKPIPEPKDLNRRTSRLLKFTKKGQPVQFNAEPYKLSDNQTVQWQVLNAKGSDEVRGNFFYAKNANHKISGNDFQNHETVTYKGLHWIRYFIINTKTNTVDVASKKYKVELKF